MALFSASLIEEDRLVHGTANPASRLLNTKRVVFYWQENNAAETWFRYDETDGNREQPTKNKHNGTRVQFQALLDEEPGQNFLVLNCTSWRPQLKTKKGIGNFREFPTGRIGIRIDYIYKVEADPNNAVYSYISLEYGQFGTVKIRVPYTQDEIDRIESGSGSL
jgi:hypothetical protein